MTGVSMTSTNTERPPHPKATASYRALVQKLDLDARLVSLADRSDELRGLGEQVPAGTGDLVLNAVRAAIVEAETTDVSRYRVPTTRAEQDEAILDLLPAIRRAANTIAYKWPGTVTGDEMVQSLCAHFLGRKGSLSKLLSMAPGERDASLIRVGHQLASAARDDYEQFSGQYAYSVDEVRKLLEKGALDGQALGYIAATADLLLGFDQVAPSYRESLHARYVGDEQPARQSAAAKQLERAVDELTVQMNRIRISEVKEFRNGGRRGRTAVPNIEAIEQADLDYNGEEIEIDE